MWKAINNQASSTQHVWRINEYFRHESFGTTLLYWMNLQFWYCFDPGATCKILENSKCFDVIEFLNFETWFQNDLETKCFSVHLNTIQHVNPLITCFFGQITFWLSNDTNKSANFWIKLINKLKKKTYWPGWFGLWMFVMLNW